MYPFLSSPRVSRPPHDAPLVVESLVIDWSIPVNFLFVAADRDRINRPVH
jgi:hypothetical protein